MRRVVGRPAGLVGGHQLAAHVAVHRASQHDHDARRPAYAAPRHRHLLAARRHQHGGRHLGDAHDVSHGLLQGAGVSDGEERVLLVHEQGARRHARGLVDLGVAALLDARDDRVEVVPPVEVALVGHEPGQEAVGRLDLALGLRAARAAQLQLEAGVLGERPDSLDVRAAAALERHERRHVVGDPLPRHAAEPHDGQVHAPHQVVGGARVRPDVHVPARMAQRRREHVELEQLAVAVGHPYRPPPVELQLQARRGLEARVGLGAALRPDGDALLARELGERVVSRQPLVRVAVQQPLVDALLGHARQRRLGL